MGQTLGCRGGLHTDDLAASRCHLKRPQSPHKTKKAGCHSIFSHKGEPQTEPSRNESEPGPGGGARTEPQGRGLALQGPLHLCSGRNGHAASQAFTGMRSAQGKAPMEEDAVPLSGCFRDPQPGQNPLLKQHQWQLGPVRSAHLTRGTAASLIVYGFICICVRKT